MLSTLRRRSTLLALVTGAALLLGACGGSDEQPPAAAAPATTPAPATTAAGSDTGTASATTKPAAGGGATSAGGGTTGTAKLKVKGDAEGAVTALLGAWKHEDQELAYGYGTQGAVGSLFAQPTPAYVAFLGCVGSGKDEVTCEATTGGPSSGSTGDERGITLRTSLLPDGDTGNAFWTVTKVTVGAPGTGGVPANGPGDVPYEVIR